VTQCIIFTAVDSCKRLLAQRELLRLANPSSEPTQESTAPAQPLAHVATTTLVQTPAHAAVVKLEGPE
jgi:hypothetical protein